MRLVPRHRSSQRAKAPRISINQAEITADLHYPARTRSPGQADGAVRRGASR